jgi:hypothetical protein
LGPRNEQKVELVAMGFWMANFDRAIPGFPVNLESIDAGVAVWVIAVCHSDLHLHLSGLQV